MSGKNHPSNYRSNIQCRKVRSEIELCQNSVEWKKFIYEKNHNACHCGCTLELLFIQDLSLENITVIKC